MVPESGKHKTLNGDQLPHKKSNLGLNGHNIRYQRVLGAVAVWIDALWPRPQSGKVCEVARRTLDSNH